MFERIALVILATISPISELRGGIPLGLAFGFDPITVFTMAIILNSLVFFPVYFLMNFLNQKLLSKIDSFQKYLMNLRARAKPYLKSYGTLGLIVFVTIPLPFSGAYTGSLIAWLFGIEWKRAFATITLGVFLAGVIVLTISLGILKFIF